MTPQTKEPANALMIDIETLSLRPTAYVQQIGYCVANIETGEYLVEPRNIWPSTDQPNGHKDQGTIEWWTKQDEKVRRVVFDYSQPTFSADVIFQELRRLVEKYDCTVWGSPAMFDLAVLTNYFGGRKPWKYNFERDMMSLYKWLDPTGALQPPNNDMGHDAASDAKWQMDYLIRLRKKYQELVDTDWAYKGLQK